MYVMFSPTKLGVYKKIPSQCEGMDNLISLYIYIQIQVDNDGYSYIHNDDDGCIYLLPSIHK